jgi:DNA-binding FadR family transcriptional regulator
MAGQAHSPPINRRSHASSAVAAALEEIEANISNGVWAPGHRLPTERELEDRFGVARNTVRKGLKRLELDGKIVRQVGRGSFVADQPRPAPEISSLSERVMGASPAEIMEVRLMLEPHAAQLAAHRASAADLRRLDECLAQAAKAPDLSTFEHWDGMLHETIVNAVRNDLLTEIYEAINSVRCQPEWIKLKERTVSPTHRSNYHAEHGELVRALRERDGEMAKQLMQEHLVGVRSNLLGLT